MQRTTAAVIDERTHERRRRWARHHRVKIETYDWLVSQARERWEIAQDDAVKTANEINHWQTISAPTDSEVPGPVMQKHFHNFGPAEQPRGPMWKPASNWTSDIPSKFGNLIAEIDQILGQVARSKSVEYDKSSDYVILVLKDVITSAQAEKIRQVGRNSSIKYLLSALVYTE